MDIDFVNKVVKYNKECPSVHYWTIHYALQALGHPWPTAAGAPGPVDIINNPVGHWRAFLFQCTVFLKSPHFKRSIVLLLGIGWEVLGSASPWYIPISLLF